MLTLQGHAGTVPMRVRQDAQAGAAHMSMVLENMCTAPQEEAGVPEVRLQGTTSGPEGSEDSAGSWG